VSNLKNIKESFTNQELINNAREVSEKLRLNNPLEIYMDLGATRIERMP
jgi:hypothetical protein